MITLSPHTSKDKPHYTYVLEYPEDYPELDKAGTVFYVGKGVGKRIQQHEQEARRGVQSYKCNVIRKILANGCRVVKRILAYFETHEEACMYEIALIFFLPGLTNKTGGGDGAMGVVISEETRQKLRESHMGQVPSNLQQLIEMNRDRTGKKRPEETRRKISRANKGKRPSAECIRRAIEANKGRPGKPISEEMRKHLSEVNKARWANMTEEEREKHQRKLNEAAKERIGRSLSEDHRRKLSEVKRGKPGKPVPKEQRRRHSVYMKQYYKEHIPPNKGKLMSEKQKEILRTANTGRKQSPETIAKRIAANTGRKRTDEQKRRISESLKGKKMSEAARQKMSEMRKGKPGKPRSEETKRKISEAAKRRAEQKQSINAHIPPLDVYTQDLLFPLKSSDIYQLSINFDASADVESL